MALNFTETGSRRRRRTPQAFANSSKVSSPSRIFYSDSDEEEGGGEKRQRHHSAQTYAAACSLGRFFLNPCLCLAKATRLCFQIVLQPLFTPLVRNLGGRYPSCRRSSQKERRMLRLEYLPIIALLFVLWFLRSDENQWITRPRSDWQLDQLPVTVRLFDFTAVEDVGGWMYGTRSFANFPTAEARRNDSESIAEDEEDHEHESGADYGGLLFSSLTNVPFSKFSRRISPRDSETYEKEKQSQLKQMDSHNVSFVYLHDEEIQFVQTECKRPNWVSSYYPNCNNFHELDLSRGYEAERTTNVDTTDYHSFYFSSGYFRDAWGLGTRSKDALVLKSLRYPKHKFDHRTMYTVRQDAVAMERLSSSPRIVDIFGHCATSVQVEHLPYEVEEYIVPGSGRIKQHELSDSQDVNPKNDYNATEKLQMALDMAESLADLHGFKDGVIVHDDVQLCQWLRTKDGKLKLGDFNRAEFMNWSEKKNAYCKHNNGEGYGEYRSPEEFAGLDLNEQIDVFSFGNNIYALLTGLWVYYDIDDDGVSQKKVIGGNLPFVDNRYRTRSFAEGKLVSVMEKCWEHDPSKRISIFEAVELLRNAVVENARS